VLLHRLSLLRLSFRCIQRDLTKTPEANSITELRQEAKRGRENKRRSCLLLSLSCLPPTPSPDLSTWTLTRKKKLIRPAPAPEPKPPPRKTHSTSTPESGKGKQSRAEKKSRKAMLKLGMRPVPGVVRVTMRRSKNVLFVIQNPDVMKSPASDSYVIFGEAKIEDAGASQAAQVARQFAPPAAPATPSPSGSADAAEASAAAASKADAGAKGAAGKGAAAADDDGEPVDETGVEAKDVELVMTQASVSRAKAVKALKESEGDIVSAIMSLTM